MKVEMENHTAQELFELLNDTDECPFVEAKGGGESTHTIMETVCAYANEPGLGGGYILMGVAEDDTELFPQYKVVPVINPDKFQRDFASQCASMFNIPIRPKVGVEKIKSETVVKVWVDELPAKQKPLYFKSEGLPGGAYRRIGSTDQRCTDDDMHVFYQNADSFDRSAVKGTSIEDADEHALQRYRALRRNVNPSAEELTYEDQELLEALGCVNKENKLELNIAGLLLFGNSKIQRSNYPMLRVDYIRVPGNSWVPNPDNRFTTIDMRGPLLLMVFRLMDAINADLPKGFLLQEGEVQAGTPGLPVRALREAIVNALMHRSYREHRPTQVIRYDNRIEIINPGYSLKPEERLGMPGSETRNPFIAAVFHDTNLAETKGSGIKAMRRLMKDSHLAPPTFESSRENNEFTTRLLLHHFLGEEDIKWLTQFSGYELSDSQKQALLFVREVGAIDNHTYRQMANCDTLKASSDLRILKSNNLLKLKGKGKATYYVAGDGISAPPLDLSAPLPDLSAPPPDLSAPPPDLSAPLPDLSAPPLEILERIKALNKREHDQGKVEGIIIDLCSIKPWKAGEIAGYFQKGETYIKRKYLSKMIAQKKLKYLHPEMLNHPEQAYLTNNL